LARYRGHLISPHDPREVWEYLADLRSIAEWDPSVEDARLVSGSPLERGARYEVDVRFLGRRVTLPYTTVELAPGRVVFSAQANAMSVRDEARVAAIPDGGSAVTWDAEVRLRGPQRILDLPLRAVFGRIGGQARNGLAERLAEPTLARPRARVSA
jgi:Polyketide cyclase / dehydrase and lipid transport